MRQALKRKQQGGYTIVEYLVALVLGLVIVWQTAEMVMDNLVEHQEEYLHSMSQPTV